MAQMTIAQRREARLFRFENEYFNGRDDIPRKLINRYYRLCGADERLLCLTNDERTANKKWVLELEDETYNRMMKLKSDFEKYGLTLVYYGYLPTIVETDTKIMAYEPIFYR